MKLKTRELAAALRYWQREGIMSDGHEHSLADDDGTIEPLDVIEIDALCERINTDPDPSDEPVLTMTRGDIEGSLEGHFEGLDIGRKPTQEELDHACHWVQEDFDYTHVFDAIDSILNFRMGAEELSTA
jgi:hypothetical protein